LNIFENNRNDSRVASPLIENLRRKLRDQFPEAHGSCQPAETVQAPVRPFSMELFPTGAISEVVPAGATSGISLLVAGIVKDSEAGVSFPEIVLIDGADHFDPGSFSGASCSRLLWVRCACAMDMIKAADLMVRDGNLPFLMLDATGLSQTELARIPAAAWWRLRQLAGSNGSRLVVMSPGPVVPCAAYRLSLNSDLTLADFDRSRGELLERVRAIPEKLRRAT
jgi:hypothetical protein